MIFASLEGLFAHGGSVFSFGRRLWQLGVAQAALQRACEFTSKFFHDGSVGESPTHVFPLPPFCTDGRVVRYRMGNLDDEDDSAIARGVNLVQAVLNELHGGSHNSATVLTAAHRRVHARLERELHSMMVDGALLGPLEIQEFLKHQQHYAEGGVAMSLGSRGGVPATAATVNLSEELQGSFPHLARQVEEPKALPLLPNKRPGRVKPGHTWVNRTYPELVKRNVKAGLHVLKKPSQVAKHRGKLCLARLQFPRMRMRTESSQIQLLTNCWIQTSYQDPGLRIFPSLGQRVHTSQEF